MKQFPWIIVVLIAICSVHITMANLQRPNSTAEYMPLPTLFRSVFAGRPVLGYPKDPDAVPANKKEDESEVDNRLDDAVEENKINTEGVGSEESDEDDSSSNESRIKKSASSSDESGSDEDESDEDESDEDDESDEEDDDDEKPKRKPSRWRQTRYGSSFRLQAVGRPINYGRLHNSRNPETPRY